MKKECLNNLKKGDYLLCIQGNGWTEKNSIYKFLRGSPRSEYLVSDSNGYSLYFTQDGMLTFFNKLNKEELEIAKLLYEE